MLYRKVNNKWTEWNGEPIKGFRHPLNIEQLWDKESLAEIGLFRAEEEPIPEGKRAKKSSLKKTDDGLKWVHQLVDEEVTSEMVNRERDRRIVGGMVFEGNLYDTDSISIERIVRQALVDRGLNFPVESEWITKDNQRVMVNVNKLLAAYQRWESAHIRAARNLKDMNPIPLDYADDKYWPVKIEK